MYFDLTEEQYMLKDSIESMLASKNEDAQQVKKYDDKPGLDRDIWPALVAVGLPMVLPTEEQGGLGMGLLTLAVAAEVQGYYAAATPMQDHCLVIKALADHNAADGRLPGLLAGEQVAVLAWSEGQGNWLPSQWSLVERDGLLNGVKRDVIFARDADFFLVGLQGQRMAMVAKDAAGLVIEAVESVDRTQPISTLTFENTPCEILTLEASQVGAVFDAALILQAADSFGLGRHSVDISVEYAKTREQFGRLIGEFQALKHQLANMALEVEPCRALYWHAAHAWDSNPEEAPRAVVIANAHITEVAVKTARAAVEVHGGIAITWEFVLHIWLKRAMHNKVRFGLPAAQRARSALLARW